MRQQTKTRLKKGSTILALAVATVGVWEGLRLVAYRDIVGVPTVCFGETRGVKMGDRYTKEQCETMLGDGLKEFEQNMRRCLKDPDDIPDGAYVAFLSLSYNIGTGAFCRSSIARAANQKDYKRACDNLLLYNKAGGRKVQGLVNRRNHERKICLQSLGG